MHAFYSTFIAATSATCLALTGQAAQVTITPTDSAGFLVGSFGNSNGGSSQIEATTLIDSDGSLAINGDRTRYFITNTGMNLGLLNELSTFSFDWTVVQEGLTVPTAQAPALRLAVTDPTTPDRTHEIIWEDGEQSTRQFVAGNGSLNTVYEGDFFDADADKARVYAITSPFGSFGRGIFDGSSLIPGSDSAQPFANFTSDSLTAYGLSDQAFVTAIVVGVGSSVGDFQGFADNIEIGFDGGDVTTFNFAIPEPASIALIAVGLCAAGLRRRA
ncbi:MAG: PEP-CTERM sorting domain-containing protein [Planctomycetota bacterium]